MKISNLQQRPKYRKFMVWYTLWLHLVQAGHMPICWHALVKNIIVWWRYLNCFSLLAAFCTCTILLWTTRTRHIAGVWFSYELHVPDI
jgi:hypothetical protein